MEIMKNLQVVEKAKKIIDGCTNETQLNAAEKYCDLYYEMFEDFANYRILLHRLNEKSKSI